MLGAYLLRKEGSGAKNPQLVKSFKSVQREIGSETFCWNCAIMNGMYWLRNQKIQFPVQLWRFFGDLTPITMTQPHVPHRVVVRTRRGEELWIFILPYIYKTWCPWCFICVIRVVHLVWSAPGDVLGEGDVLSTPLIFSSVAEFSGEGLPTKCCSFYLFLALKSLHCIGCYCSPICLVSKHSP